MTSKIRIGDIFRYARPYSAAAPDVDGLPNFFHRVASDGMPLPLLEAGINPIQPPAKGLPTPAILISSSPHKVGSEKTPWQDYFRPDYGHIRYFGDNKLPGSDPSATRGNAALLRQFEISGSREIPDRMRAAPLLYFRRIRIGTRAKGNLQFHGFGLVERVERIVQVHSQSKLTFVNYAFDLAVFSLAEENEEFDWAWIAQRRQGGCSPQESLTFAPAAWRRWVRFGNVAIESCRRRVSRLSTISAAERKVKSPSDELSILRQILEFYEGRKGRFEALAAYVAQRILSSSGATYVSGWITQASGDGGADFVGRLDLGSEMARVKLVVLGQAKCERLDSPTGGNHIARTVARLRRGWLGVYVTTSYFSESVQREVIEDQYPILLVDGKRVAAEIAAAIHERGEDEPGKLFLEVDATYGNLVARRSPEEILLV